MATLKFTIPDDAPEKNKNTVAVYKRHLNILAKELVITTVEEALAQQKEITEFVTKKVPDTDISYKAKRRVFFSALFWVLTNKPLTEKKEFFDYYQTIKDSHEKQVIKTADEVIAEQELAKKVSTRIKIKRRKPVA